MPRNLEKPFALQRPWSEEEDKFLAEQRAKGVSIRELSRIMGRSINAIRFRCSQLIGDDFSHLSFDERKEYERKKKNRTCLRCKRAFVAPSKYIRLCKQCRVFVAEISSPFVS